ncbi:MAG: hypothetical protein KDA84_15965 [Planctomycetaceae bacterium]|nr:hypothetical protein [Planctomycetaceae bacterium]
MERIDAELPALFSYPVKQRNQIIDALFYDVNALTDEEQEKISPFSDREGMIIVVPPRNSDGEWRHYENANRFAIEEGDSIQALALAGVGSSVLGTAALARNIADHYGFDVAGIVSGYGVADVMSEALGGWFFYGTTDQFWREAESLARNLTSAWEQTLAYLSGSESKISEKSFEKDQREPRTSDIHTLYEVLASCKNLRLIVGHSKGNLLTSHALRQFAYQRGNADHRYFEDLTIITLGAVVGLHDRFQRKYQFLGGLDLLGKLNSQLELPHQSIIGAGHHLNPSIPMHLSVQEVLATVQLADA